jgi:hypothetical protein
MNVNRPEGFADLDEEKAGSEPPPKKPADDFFGDSSPSNSIPEAIPWGELCKKKMEEPPHTISDCARVGHLMSITGSSKTHKSFTLAELIHAVATGGEFFGKQCLKGKVLAVDFELGEFTFQRRLLEIEKQKGTAMGDNLLYLAMETVDNPNIDKLVKRIEAEHKKHPFVLIAIDPVYTLFGNAEENSNTEMSAFTGKLKRLSRSIGALVVYVHHHSKGSQKGKRSIDMASGAASLVARPCDCIMSLDWVGDDADSATVYTVSWTLRHFKPMPKLYAERDGCLWKLTDKETADKIAAEAGRQYKPSEILECLDSSSSGMSDGKWYAATVKRYQSLTLLITEPRDCL